MKHCSLQLVQLQCFVLSGNMMQRKSIMEIIDNYGRLLYSYSYVVALSLMQVYFFSKIRQKTRFEQGCAFLMPQNLNPRLPFTPKTAISGPLSTKLRNFRPKTASTLDMLTCK